MTRNSGEQSIVVPVLVFVLVALVVYTLAQQNFSISRLNKTDRIACAFIRADASTRRAQASNSERSLIAERQYIKRTRKVIALFQVPQPKQTTQQRKGSNQFKAYLLSQMTVWIINTTVQKRNIQLTRSLSVKASELAGNLNCVP